MIKRILIVLCIIGSVVLCSCTSKQNAETKPYYNTSVTFKEKEIGETVSVPKSEYEEFAKKISIDNMCCDTIDG